tara:strand:- start:141 stop:1430 length:1290 start_codon:yes stop_codon:yes gene_type:complete
MFYRLSQMEDELNDTNSKNDKMDILRMYPDLKRVLEYTYNPYKKYGVKSSQLKKHYNVLVPVSTEVDFFDILDKLASREVTGHSAIAVLNGFAENLSAPDVELMHRILDKNLKTRTDAKLINKVWLNLIPQFNVALAQKFEDHAHKIDWENEHWLGSRKLDGVRVLAVKRDGVVKFFSRAGNEFTTLGKLKDELELTYTWSVDDDFVLDGELCVMDENGNEDYKSVVSQIKRKDYTIENPMFIVFDHLTLEEFDNGTSEVSTADRIDRVTSGQYFKALEMESITSEEQAVAKLDDAVDSGWEGYMIRRADAPYEGKRTRALLKMKKMHDEEYTVKSIETGPFRMIDKSTGLEKTIETLTNVIIEHKGNAVSVGSGFSLDDRVKYYGNPELIVGKDITVQYFELSKDKDGKESLRFPVVKHVFEDGKRTT